MRTGQQIMVTRTALREAIADLERLTGGDTGDYGAAAPVLARLYTTYAQITLEAYGISVDLPNLCGDHSLHGFGRAGVFPPQTRH